MRIVFMGTGEIALPTLEWLIDHCGRGEDELVAVYTQPDKPVGRKQVLTPPEVKVVALGSGTPVFQPERLKGNETALAEFASLRPDLVVVMAYGQILPVGLLRIPALACVNLHASLLPRHRGAAPIQAAIRDGDVETGITLMHVVPKLDAGDMILKMAIPILPDETGGRLHDRLASLGPSVIAEGLERFRAGIPEARAQQEDLVTYTGKLEREDGEIDWTNTSESIERLIRAYEPWPGTKTSFVLGEERKALKIFPPARVCSHCDDAGDVPPGTVLASDVSLRVKCGEGTLELAGDLQLEGRKRLPAEAFLRGTSIPVGTILGTGKIAV